MTPELLWGFLPKPIAVVLAVILAIAYVISEVAGKFNGPLSKLLARRDARRQERSAGWQERDRRVEELEQAREYQDERYALVMDEVKALREELRWLHKLSDHQRRAIRAHTDWDNEWVPKARRAGMDIPDPPDLYVYLNDEEPVL